MRAAVFLALTVLVTGLALSLDAQQRGGGAGTLRPSPTGEAPKGTGAISGVVIDATTGKPIEGAIVSLGVTSLGPVQSTLPRTLTDSKGRFLLRNLAPSTRYYLRAARTGYGNARYGSSGPSMLTKLSDLEIRTTDDIVPIAVAADQWVSDLKIQLWRFGSISGRVVDERNEAVVGVAVRAFSRVLIAGHSQYIGTDVVTTDDRGDYRIANLMPGSYAVSVLSVQSTVLATTPETPGRRAVGELSQSGSGGSNGGMPAIDVDGTHRLVISSYATPPPAAGAARAYAAVFYPAATTISNGAQSIEIGYGVSRGGIDFQLRPVPAVRVSGHLEYSPQLASPDGPPEFLLRLMPAGSEQLGVGSEAATTPVERDGSFTFLNVPAGDYTLLAQSSISEFTTGVGETSLPDPPGLPIAGPVQATLGPADKPGFQFAFRRGKAQRMWGRASVSVGGQDVAGVVVQMHPTVTVRGRIVMSPGGSGARLFATVSATPANGDLTLGRVATAVDVSDSSPFALEGLLDGTYLIGLPGYFKSESVMSVTQAGRDIRDTGIDTSSGRDVDDVVVTLTDAVTEIKGTVRGSQAAPAAVIAFPVEKSQWVDYGWDPLRIGVKSADANGPFSIVGLSEGDYFVVAVDASQHDAWRDPKFLEAAAGVATRVSIKWGEHKSIDLSMSKVVAK